MTTAEFVADTVLTATGKVINFDNTNAKWAKIVAIGNRKLREWARESGVDWFSLYDPAYLVGTVTANQTFDLDDEIRKISQQEGDYVRIVPSGSAADQYTQYTTTTADRLLGYQNNYVAQVGRTLRFITPFTSSSSLFGGKIYAPVYLYPDPFTNNNDTINCDNPDWLVVATAAEYIRNDITRSGQFGNLIAEANDLMDGMKADNESQDSTVARPWNPMSHLSGGWDS